MTLSYDIFVIPPNTEITLSVEYIAEEVNDIYVDEVYILSKDKGSWNPIDTDGLLINISKDPLVPKIESLSLWIHNQCEQDYINMLADMADFENER